MACVLLAGADLVLLHALPAPQLHATTGATIAYRPWNFLSELVRTDYGPLMTACFFLLGVGCGAAAWALREHEQRRASALLAVASVALLLLGFFPTDLADLTTDAYSCGLPTRPEPCTFVGRIHNPLSILIFVPLLLAIVSLSRQRVPFLTRLGQVCGALMLCGSVGVALYLWSIGWHGRWWTGLLQRSLVFPALLWLLGLLGWLAKKSPA